MAMAFVGGKNCATSQYRVCVMCHLSAPQDLWVDMGRDAGRLLLDPNASHMRRESMQSGYSSRRRRRISTLVTYAYQHTCSLVSNDLVLPAPVLRCFFQKCEGWVMIGAVVVAQMAALLCQ